MSAPRLTVPLELETPLRIPDGMGGYARQWAVLGRLWAEMRPVGGGERAGDAGSLSITTWRITVRAAGVGDPRRPRPDQRLAIGSGASRRNFRIEAVAEAGPGQRYLVCHATEEVGL